MTETPISLDALRDRDHRERGDLVPLPSWFRIVTEDELGALVEAVSAAQEERSARFSMHKTPSTEPKLYAERRARWSAASVRLVIALSRFVSEQPPNGKSSSEPGA